MKLEQCTKLEQRMKLEQLLELKLKEIKMKFYSKFLNEKCSSKYHMMVLILVPSMKRMVLCMMVPSKKLAMHLGTRLMMAKCMSLSTMLMDK